MPSPQEIINNALVDIGQLGAGESAPNGEDNALGLRHLNQIIKLWAAQGNMSYFEFSQSFPFAVSQQAYTLGPVDSGADFIITGAGSGVRPPKINRAKLVLSGGHEIDLPILFKREYESISMPSQSGQPLQLFYKTSFPTGTLYPWPYPTSVTDELKLYFGSQLTEIVMDDIEVNIDLPPAMEDAIHWTLVERLCVPFLKQVPPQVKIQAHGARQVFRQLNDSDPVFIGTDIYREGHGSNYVTTYDGR